MKIITAADSNMKEMVQLCIEQNAAFSYQTILFDIGNLGFGIPFDVQEYTQPTLNNPRAQKVPYKAAIIQEAMERIGWSETAVWMDADAYCIRSIHEVFQNDFDVAVTMRRQGEMPGSPHPMFDCYTNSGVVFIRKTMASLRLIDKWVRRTPSVSTMSDQEALNFLLIDDIDFTRYDQVFDVEGIKVMVLSTDDYNWYYFDEKIKPETKVVHFKGPMEEKWKHFRKYLNPWVGGVKSLEGYIL